MASSAVNIGELIRLARKAKNLRQVDLAHLIGLKSPVQIIQWEKNRHRPNSNNRGKLARALDISFEPTRRLAHEETNAVKTVKISERIRRARKRKKLSQTALGKQLRPPKTQGAIANWEKNGPPQNDELLAQLERILAIQLESSSANEEDQDQLEQVHNTNIRSESAPENAEEDKSMKSKILFEVKGCITVPCERRPGGWRFFPDGKPKKQFWKEHSHLGNQRGVFVFALKTGKAITPIYVGQAKKTFSQECFADGKMNKYKDGLCHHTQGRAVMFFIVHPSQRGQPNTKAIGEIEKRLIQLADMKNPNLTNTQHNRRKWSIQGITGDTGVGHHAKDLRIALGLAEKVEQ